MDAVNFLGHLRASARAIQVAPPAQAPPPPSAPQGLSAARPQGLAGKPPYSKDRYPASFAGRPKGAKSKAPGRRQMESALGAAVAMRTGNPKYEAESTAPDFLQRFGVKRTVITRLANELASGNMTMTGAVSSFQESVGRLKNIPDGSYVMPQVQNLISMETARVPGNQGSNIQAIATQGAHTRVGVAGGVGAAAVGQTSTGYVPGGQIASTVPSILPTVSAMNQDERALHGSAGAGAMGGAAPGELNVATGGNRAVREEYAAHPNASATAAAAASRVSRSRSSSTESERPTPDYPSLFSAGEESGGGGAGAAGAAPSKKTKKPRAPKA